MPAHIAGAKIAALFRPPGGALVGGDFYDLFPVTRRTWGIVIGDVCGKGPLAASRSNVARYSLPGAAVHGDSPAETLRRVNQALLAGESVDGLVEIHTDRGVSGRAEFERRLAACAGLAPAAIVDRLAAAINVNDDDAAIIAVQAT